MQLRAFPLKDFAAQYVLGEVIVSGNLDAESGLGVHDVGVQLHRSDRIERRLLHELTEGLIETQSAVLGGKQGVERDFELEQRLLCGLHFDWRCAFGWLGSRRGGRSFVEGHDVNHKRSVGESVHHFIVEVDERRAKEVVVKSVNVGEGGVLSVRLRLQDWTEGRSTKLFVTSGNPLEHVVTIDDSQVEPHVEFFSVYLQTQSQLIDLDTKKNNC